MKKRWTLQRYGELSLHSKGYDVNHRFGLLNPPISKSRMVVEKAVQRSVFLRIQHRILNANSSKIDSSFLPVSVIGEQCCHHFLFLFIFLRVHGHLHSNLYYRVSMVTTVADYKFCREDVAIGTTTEQFSLLDLVVFNDMLFLKIQKTLRKTKEYRFIE